MYTSCSLKGFQKIHKTLINPPKDSLTDRASRKIKYFKVGDVIFLSSVIAFLAQRVLALAIPILAFLDALKYTAKSIKFCASLQFDKAGEELVHLIRSLAIAVIGFLTLPLALTIPSTFYRTSKDWHSLMLSNFKEDILSFEKESRKENENGSLSQKTMRKAFEKSRDQLVTNNEAKNRIDSVIERMLEQIDCEREDAEQIFDANADWYSHFLTECQLQKFSIEAADPQFLHVTNSLLKLRNPELRETLTKAAIRDYATGHEAPARLKEYLEIYASEREVKVNEEFESLKLARQTAVKNNQDPRIKLAQAQKRLANQEKKLQEEETKLPTIENKKIAGQVKKIEGMKQGIATQKNTIKELEEQVANLEKHSEEELEGMLREQAESKFPAFNCDVHYFLKLYFLLRIVGPSEKDFFENSMQLIMAGKFKDATHGNKLLSLLHTLSTSCEKETARKTLELCYTYFSQPEGMKKTIQAITNALTLFKMGLFDRFKEVVTSTKPDGMTLDSTLLLARIFAEKFDLSSLDQYQGDEGVAKMAQEYENTVATFRDPAAILIYLATLSNLSGTERKKAIQALKEFVIHILDGTLHTWMHDETRSEHLKKVFLTPGLKENWMKCGLGSLKDLGITDPAYDSYLIGETTDPCDLLMQTVEIEGSCLHLGGRPDKSKGLLGYLLDGKIHSIVLKAKDGRIVARSLCRLLWNEAVGKSVLVLDHIYTTNTQNKALFKEWIVSYAKKRSRDLGLDLVTTISSLGSEPYGEVESKGSPVPFEYLDYSRNITDGIYTIGRTYKIE